MTWLSHRRREPSDEAKTALQRSQISLALARDLEVRSVKVSQEIHDTLERNHLVDAIEATILGVRP